MKSLLLLCVLSGSAVGAETDLIGGRQVRREDWPELVRIRQGSATCSAVIAGPKVLITAAHCSRPDGEVVPVSESEDVEVEYLAGAARYTARCTLSPQYRSQGHDMAICVADTTLPRPWARVAAEGPKLGEMVTLSGFGCVNSSGTGGNNGTLKVGDVRVTAVPSGRPNGYWFETRGSVALCYGDSGGPAFKKVATSGAREVYGVNSRGNIRDLSMMTDLGLRVSKQFMAEWAIANQTPICGFNSECK